MIGAGGGRIGGGNVGNPNPFLASIRAGPAVSNGSTFVNASGWPYTAGKDVLFRVFARDAFGNAASDVARDDVRVTFEGTFGAVVSLTGKFTHLSPSIHWMSSSLS